MRTILNNKGFTLIELLVVIAITAFLMSVVFSAYSINQKQARDKQRKADMKQIQSALEIYRAEYGLYPFFNNSSSPDYDETGTGWDRVSNLNEGRSSPPNPAVPNLSPRYLKTTLSDPLVGDDGPNVYCYYHEANRLRYIIFFSLENNQDETALSDKPMPSGPGSCTTAGSNSNFCKTYTITTGNCSLRADGSAIPGGAVYNAWVTNP